MQTTDSHLFKTGYVTLVGKIPELSESGQQRYTYSDVILVFSKH